MYLGAPGDTELSDDAIRHLAVSAQRFYYASLQDKNPVISARHNAYAVAIVHQLSNLASREKIQAAAGVDIRSLRWQIMAAQDAQEQLIFKILEKMTEKGIDVRTIMNGNVEKLIDHAGREAEYAG